MDKVKVGKRNSLARELVLWFLVLSIFPLFTVAWFNYQQTESTLKNAAIDHLNDTSSLKIHFINNWFDYRLMDLASQAESKSNAELLMIFNQRFNASKKNIAGYVKSYDWAKISDQYGHDLTTFASRYDYILDVFLIDQQGNVLYSIAQNSDLGSNLLSGPYKNTEFSKMVQQTLASGDSLFSGIERYAPSSGIEGQKISDNELAGFLTAPLLDQEGRKQGVIAIQLNLNRVFNVLKSQNVSEKSERHYLVTNEGKLISPITNNWGEVLNRIISLNKIKLPDLVSGQVLEYKGPQNVEVFGTHHGVKILNKSWYLISEIDIDEALASTHTIAKVTLALLLLTISLVILIAVSIARKITRPLKALADASMNVAAGDTDQLVDILIKNEIGQLAESFNHMLEVRQGHEQALQKSAIKTAKVLEELKEQKFALDQHSIVAITDIKGTITFANEKFSEISGYSHDELIGANHRLLNSGVHSYSFFKQMFHCIKNGQVWRGEICNKTKSGSLYWVDTTIVPFMGDDNKPLSYIAIRTDITEREKSRFDLIKAKEQAEMAAQAKSEFLASMSHEIRTPMNGVLGMLGLLKNMELTQSQLHRVNIAQTSAQSLLTLINDILDFSKVDAGKMELEHLDFNLRSILGEFADAMGHQAQTKGLELILDIKQIEESQVRGDPGRLRQIITNIVSNAIKFTSVGEIVISAKLQSISEDGWQFECDIADTGIGIPEDKIADLFDSFSQVDASTTREFGGTGLGLAIVKKLCELMGGEVSVTSKAGEGSCFHVKLLLQKSKLSQQVLPQVDMEKLNLLMVDDNDTNREVLRAQLEHWGATVIEAESGQQALEICEQRINQQDEEFFDIAFLDMQMPGMDGAQLGKKLKADKRFEKMKLIMMTSMGHRGDARYFAGLGFDAYFPKPATTSDLFEALSVVAKGGVVLEQAEPLVTSHYLKTLIPPERKVSRVFDCATLKQVRILLVEDNQMNQMVATGILNQYGIEMIDIAGNGLEALTSLQQAPEDAPYSMVLMDCQMPEMDGYQASTQIRAGKAGERNKGIVIIAMTANAMTGDRDKCLQAGMNDYVAKPIDADFLYEKIVQWLMGIAASHGVEKNSTQEANSTQKESLVSWDKKSALKRIGGNEKLLRALTHVFYKENPLQLDELQQAIDCEDFDKIYQLLHILKGVTANLSGLKLQSILTEMESLTSVKDLESIKDYMPILISACEELKQCFMQYNSEQDAKNEVSTENDLSLNHSEIMSHLHELNKKLKNNDFIDQDELSPLVQQNNTELQELIDRLVEKINQFDNEGATAMVSECITFINREGGK